jgi:large subunit ribosomal protein L9
MKVILNKDLATLGEEGDVKEVARGYARNYLFPRGIALPYTPRMIKIIESRRAEIEARKEQKRLDARGLKEKLDTLELSLTMPAGANGKLYGAVTNQTIADELAKSGFQIERKRIELAGNGFKNVGKYKAAIKLYESQSAEITITIIAQEIKVEASASKPAPKRGRRDRQESHVQETPAVETPAEAAAAEEKAETPAE